MAGHTENMEALRAILTTLTRETAWARKNEISQAIDVAFSTVTWTPALGAAATDAAARCFEAIQLASRAATAGTPEQDQAVRDALAAVDTLERALDAAAPASR
jgi:hypothetical protein